MDQTRYQEAQESYAAGDYRAAAKQFLASAGRGADGNGAAYHMAGNSLIRLRRYQDAVTVYGHALRDPLYEKRGAVQANLGTAYVALADYAKACEAYENALAEPDCTNSSKALQGLAGALLERGKVEEAAVNYRKAALDPTNTDPGKALVNLGMCFMAMGRPADAVEAYKAALGFEDYQGRGRALANLGQAYTALGQYNDAVKSFEKAIELHGYQLSAPAAAAYETALNAKQEARELVEGWDTSETPPAPAPVDAGDAPDTPLGADGDTAAVAAPDLGFGDEAAVSDFFSVTEDEMRERDREVRRSERSEGRVAAGWKWLVGLVVLVVVLGALCAGGYALGFGWPTQRSTVAGLLGAYRDGGVLDSYWVAAPGSSVAREMAKVAPLTSFTIDSVRRGPQTSVALVTVTPKSGAPLHYIVTLSREGVGWRVSGVENDWGSTGGGS